MVVLMSPINLSNLITWFSFGDCLGEDWKKQPCWGKCITNNKLQNLIRLA